MFKRYIFLSLIVLLFISCDTDTKKDICDSVNCGDNGECAIDNDTAICVCYNGYETSSDKKSCLKDGVIDPCSPNPCKDTHKTICKATSDTFSCNCDLGYRLKDGKCEKSNGLHIRIMGANITSGPKQAYEENGIRIFKAIKPDIVMIQEFNYESGGLRDLVNKAFGKNYNYFKGNGRIPNGVISKYPIIKSGNFDDPGASDRDFAYAKIELPNGKFLWAISAHFKYKKPAVQKNEAEAVNTFINSNISNDDYFVIGGDFNTKSRTAGCIIELGNHFDVSAPFPNGYNDFSDSTTCYKCIKKGNTPDCNDCVSTATSYERDDPYDWVLADKILDKMQVETSYCKNGDNSDCLYFPNGLVFDSRDYTQDQLDDYFFPVQVGDCSRGDVAPFIGNNANFQHMGVVKDFEIE